MSFALPELTTMASEIVLSLYPILIKVVDTGLDSQLLARTTTFAVLAFALTTQSGLTAVLQQPVTLLILGALNFVHIGTSYLAFQDLPAGPAMALFYTYPFWNLLLSWLVLGETIDVSTLPWFLLAFVGSWFVVKSMTQEEVFQDKKAQDTSSHVSRGVFAAIAAAFTEAGIYLVTKSLNATTPFAMMFQLYGGALVCLLVGLLSLGKPLLSDTKSSTWIPLIGFNALIGFIGYALRFWSIPRLSVTIFSILSFVGVFSAYVFGLRFVNEVPNWDSLLGGGLIATAIAALRINSTGITE
jgi:drug/metabolite transporter (DMT)-like permease